MKNQIVLFVCTNICGVNCKFRFSSFYEVASQVAALDIGYKPGASELRDRKPKVVFLLGADEDTVTRNDLPNDAFVVYIGGYTRFFCYTLDTLQVYTNCVSDFWLYHTNGF